MAANTQQDNLPSYNNDNAPPSYDVESVKAHLSSLAEGDPNESIEVPMITRTGGMVKDNPLGWMNPFSKKGFGTIKTSVTTRKMPRSFYLKHYAKDIEGNYVGTGAPAPDQANVFVPSKSSPEEMLKQSNEVAMRMQEIRGGGIGSYGTPQKK